MESKSWKSEVASELLDETDIVDTSNNCAVPVADKQRSPNSRQAPVAFIGNDVTQSDEFCPTQQDDFSQLPDEIVLAIFRLLPLEALIRNTRVCKRWQSVLSDESLWTRLDLGSLVLRSGAMEYLLRRGTSILKLAESKFEEPMFLNDAIDGTFKLQYLDLSGAAISRKDLVQLLRTCKHLKKLSLARCSLDNDVCSAVGQNVDLRVLNMAKCNGVTSYGVVTILAGCNKLISLNLSWVNFSCRTLNRINVRLPETLERLDISGCRTDLCDFHVDHANKTASMRLDGNDSANLSECSILSLIRLTRLTHLSLSRCPPISAISYRRLSVIKSLTHLDIFGLVSEVEIGTLQGHMVGVKVNKFEQVNVAQLTWEHV